MEVVMDLQKIKGKSVLGIVAVILVVLAVVVGVVYFMENYH
jgi:hypothetical protein